MHDLSQYSPARLGARLDDLVEFKGEAWYQQEHLCKCDDIEVDDGMLIRDCPWNSVDALEAELTRRELEAVR